MNLIEKTKQLAELESKVSYPYLVYVLPDMQTSAAGKTDADARFIHDMRMNAPMMLEVLSQFQADDTNLISDLLKEEKDLLEWYKADSAESGENYDERIEGMEAKIDCLARLQKAASLMEANDGSQ